MFNVPLFVLMLQSWFKKKNYPSIDEHVIIIFVTQKVTIATVWAYNSNRQVEILLYFQLSISMLKANFWQS